MSRQSSAGSCIARASQYGSLESNVLAGLASSGFTVKTVDHGAAFSLKLSPAHPDQPPVTVGIFEEGAFADAVSVAAALEFAGRLSKQLNAVALVPLSTLGSDGYAEFQGQLLSLHLDAALAGLSRARRALPLLPTPMTAVGVLAVLLALITEGSRSRAAATASHMARVAVEVSKAAQTHVLEGVPGVRAPPCSDSVPADDAPSWAAAPAGWDPANSGIGRRSGLAGAAPGPVASAAAAAVAVGAGAGGSVQCARADLLLSFLGERTCARRQRRLASATLPPPSPHACRLHRCDL